MCITKVATAPLVRRPLRNKVVEQLLIGLAALRNPTGASTSLCTRRLTAMGIRDRPISARSPWQNGVAERLIGSIRQDCLDHVVISGEQHLRHLLNSYQEYYNESRTHLSLKKDAPIPRDAQRVGPVLALPILGGLHHRYVRLNIRQGQPSAREDDHLRLLQRMLTIDCHAGVDFDQTVRPSLAVDDKSPRCAGRRNPR